MGQPKTVVRSSTNLVMEAEGFENIQTAEAKE